MPLSLCLCPETSGSGDSGSEHWWKERLGILWGCRQVPVLDSPCEISGKSLLPWGLSFSICQVGVLDSIPGFQWLMCSQMGKMGRKS